jgi:hypothetical protein
MITPPPIHDMFLIPETAPRPRLAPRTRVRTVARALPVLIALVLALVACAEPVRTSPDPSNLRAPAKDIVVTDGNLGTPYEILGRSRRPSEG